MIAAWGIWSLIIVGQQNWTEVKVGDCLSQEQIQRLAGIQHPEILASEKCQDEEPELSGEHYQVMACGLEVKTGSWEAEKIEHKKAGMFFPRRPPCELSTTWAQNSFSFYDPSFEMPYCEENELELVFQQREVMETKAFSAGQGRIYLPNPLRVERKSFLNFGEDTIETCDETRVWLAYAGWGRLKGRLEEWGCDWSEANEMEFCRDGKFALGEDADGQFCLEVTKWEDCLPQKED